MNPRHVTYVWHITRGSVYHHMLQQADSPKEERGDVKDDNEPSQKRRGIDYREDKKVSINTS
ncbi:hypothetical protein L208DRAFT_1416486 [Tricholoma matsutake]|nr:hypothetical protein L208DRAFT_1416486 [Tricholoma matsutake 945]